MATPNWHAPVATNNFSAGDITQLLATHAVMYAYQGTSQVSYGVTATGTLNTNTGAAAQWIAQPFTTPVGVTQLTRVELTLRDQGTGSDVTFELRTDNAGVPSNTALFSLLIPTDFVTGSAISLSIPLGALAVTASTKYHLVLDGTASTTNYVMWNRAATSVNAALTSTTGTGSWVSASVTALFNVFNGVGGVLRNTYEDAGARWTGLDYGATGGTSAPPTAVREYTGALRSVRTLSYTSGQLTSAA